MSLSALLVLLLCGAIALLLFRHLNRRTLRATKSKSKSKNRVSQVWGDTRPLGTELKQLPDDTATWQLSKLCRARALWEELEDAAANGANDSLTIVAEPDALSSFELSFAFADGDELYIREKIRGFPLGLVPWLSIVREIDAFLSQLPSKITDHIDQMTVAHQFARNDLLYRLRLRPFGPIPGIDDAYSALLFDVADEEPPDECDGDHRAVLVYVESPPDDATSVRGVTIEAPRSGCKRTRNLHVVGYVTPSVIGATEPHGRLDVDVMAKLQLPFPRWLIPKPLLRWFVPLVLKLVFPSIARLREGFEASALNESVRADVDGFYAAIARRYQAFSPSDSRTRKPIAS